MCEKFKEKFQILFVIILFEISNKLKHFCLKVRTLDFYKISLLFCTYNDIDDDKTRNEQNELGTLLYFFHTKNRA
jgi:hypothetical protein